VSNRTHAMLINQHAHVCTTNTTRVCLCALPTPSHPHCMPSLFLSHLCRSTGPLWSPRSRVGRRATTSRCLCECARWVGGLASLQRRRAVRQSPGLAPSPSTRKKTRSVWHALAFLSLQMAPASKPDRGSPGLTCGVVCVCVCVCVGVRG
jgi:hypothetical protein